MIIPKKAATQTQKIAPGPPTFMARQTATRLAIPMQPPGHKWLVIP